MVRLLSNDELNAQYLDSHYGNISDSHWPEIKNDVEGDICLDVGYSVAVTLLIVLRKDSFPHVDRALFILLQSLQ